MAIHAKIHEMNTRLKESKILCISILNYTFNLLHTQKSCLFIAKSIKSPLCVKKNGCPKKQTISLVSIPGAAGQPFCF
jgi:hypothetical protein